MQLGSEIGQKHCARCRTQLSIPAHYQDGLWFHVSCWQIGAHQLADATKISAAVRRMHEIFPPFLFFSEPEVL